MDRNPTHLNDRRAAQETAFTRLVTLRRLIRGVLVFDRVGWLVAAAIGAALLVGVIDYAARLPSWVRLCALAAGLVGIGWWWMTRVRPAAKFRPSLEELALRVERNATAGTGVLASGVGLAGEESDRAGAVVERARAVLDKVSLAQHVNWRRPALAAAMFLSAGAIVTTMLAFSPYSTVLGARRVLTPWTSAEWPKRTGVRDITGVAVHPTGYALPLRAALVKGDKTARVTVQYRVNGGPQREQALSPQGREVVLTPEQSPETATNEPLHGALLETLLEPGVLAPSSDEAAKEGTLEYWFVSADDRTDAAKVRLVPPPAVVGAEVKVTPPAYANTGGGEPRVLEAGPGTDQRATVPGVLAGSRVELTVRMNKPVRAPGTSAPSVTDRAAWARAALGEQAVAIATADDTELTVQPTVWRIVWTQRRSARLTVHPVDMDGVEPAGESVYRVEVREDRAPEAVVVQPSQDLEVLATAKVSVQTEGRDDVGVAWVAAEYAVASPKTGSSSTEVEVSGDRTELARVEAREHSSAVLSANGEIDLAKLGVGPGQEVWITAAAADAYLVDGKTHETARSAPRRVRVISPERMVEQVWNELSGVRRSAVRTVEQQDALTEKTRRGAEGVARSQVEITDAVSRLNKAVSDLSKRVKDNALNDQDLEQVLSQARSLSEQAKEASSKAGESARKAEQAKAEGDKKAQKKAQDEAASAQDTAARALEQLAETLDRGQDAWSTTRAVQRLVEDQAALRKQTGEVGEKTIGKSQEELTSSEKQKLNDLADQQQQLAKRTDEQLKKLQERAKQMKANDPAGAAAMEEAAKKGEQSGVSEQMQKAAEQIQKNQQQQAGQQQQQAQNNLEQMLEQLKQNQKSRDATLRRQLASLIETLNRLIDMQQKALAAVSAANAISEPDAHKGLDGPMVRLHTQTLAAVAQARDAGKEARRATTLLGEATEEEQEAVVGLRAAPVDGVGAEGHERESLKKLTEARDEAQRQQDAAAKRESDRQKAELKQKYTAMLTEQSAVRTEGSDLVGKELDRRTRSRARGLADREDGVADQAAALLKDSKDLQDADLFVLGHERLESLARGAAEGLRADTVGETVAAKQRGVERVLRQLIDALNEEQGDDEAFREPEGGSGSGQSGAGGTPPAVPPAAEVKLLKSMQQEALQLTREADEAKDAGAAEEAKTLQRMLADRGAKLLKKLQQQGGGR